MLIWINFSFDPASRANGRAVIMTVATDIPFDVFDLLMPALMFRQLPIDLCNFFLKVDYFGPSSSTLTPPGVLQWFW